MIDASYNALHDSITYKLLLERCICVWLKASPEEHMNRDHPEMVGKVSRDDLLGMAEEA